MKIGPFELDVLRKGTGAAVLLIHGINPIHPDSGFLNGLDSFVAPSHPGFGASPRPPEFDTMYDLVNLYLAVLDAMPSGDVTVIGFSFGGWIAAEMAVTGPRNLGRLILVDPVGIKIGGREQRDIAHFFNTDPNELLRRAWHDPGRRPAGIHGLGWQATIDETMTDQQMIGLARNWDSLCIYAWRPHMFNPQLKQWLHRIRVPTRVIWGQADGIVAPDYGRAYAGLIQGAEFRAIPNAGHHPELEQAAAFLEAIR